MTEVVRLASRSFFPKTASSLSASKIYIAHGLLGNANNWATAAQRLVDHPLLRSAVRAAVALDMRNHGNSPHHPDHSNAALASDLESVILNGQRELAQRPGVDPDRRPQHSVVISHSMGGLVNMGLLLRRYNETTLFHHSTDSTRLGQWSAARQRDYVSWMQTVNGAFGFGPKDAIRDILFWDPKAPKLDASVNPVERVPLHGRISACVVVDVTPTVHLSRDWNKDDGVYEVLDRMAKMKLDAIHSYEDAHQEMIRVGIGEKSLRDYITTNLMISSKEKGRVANWRCNFPILLETYGEFAPDIVRWFESTSAESGMSESDKGRSFVPQPCTLPILFVFGSESSFNDAGHRKQLKRFFPNLQEVVIKGAGHYVHYEKMDAFVQATAPFIAQHLRS